MISCPQYYTGVGPLYVNSHPERDPIDTQDLPYKCISCGKKRPTKAQSVYLIHACCGSLQRTNRRDLAKHVVYPHRMNRGYADSHDGSKVGPAKWCEVCPKPARNMEDVYLEEMLLSAEMLYSTGGHTSRHQHITARRKTKGDSDSQKSVTRPALSAYT